MVHQDLDLAVAARVAVEGARYRGRYRADADSLATPQPDPRTRRDVPLHPRRSRENGAHHQKVWRYQHFDSDTPFLQKRATLTACLRKVQHQSSDKAAMGYSALEKIAEFRRLRYPTSILSKACTFLAASTGEGAWITIRNALR